MSWKKHFESIGLLVILIDLRLASWILLSGILEKMKSTMASSRDIWNINIIALLPPLPMWPYSLSKSSFCNSWLVFHNNHLKTMVGFESFDLIYNIIIVLTNTALAMIHIQIIFCCLWLFSHHHQHHYISRHCFFFFFNFWLFRITWRHWLDPRALITLLMSVFSLQSDKFNFCREDSSSWKGKESVYNQYSYKRRVRYCICHWKPVSGWLWPPSHGRLLLPWSSAGSYWCSGWGREMAWKRVLNLPHIDCHHNKPGFM